MNLKPTNVPREDNFVPLPMCAFNTLTGMQTNEFTTVATKLINASTPCRWVVIYAYNTNGNTVAIGDANAKAEPITGVAQAPFCDACVQVMGRIETAQEAERVYTQYRFEKPRKRGRPKNRSTAGRPSVIDASVVLKLEYAFSRGCTINEAIQYAGISKNAFYGWVALNPEFREGIEGLRQNPTIWARYSVFEAIKRDGSLALKYLERKLPEEFSLKANVKHTYEFTGISLDKPEPIEPIKDENPMPKIEIVRFD